MPTSLVDSEHPRVPVGYAARLSLLVHKLAGELLDRAGEAPAFSLSAREYTARLETRGLVARRTNPDDRRRTLVELTTPGKKALARADEATARIEAEVLGDLDQSERRLLHEMLCRALGSHAERREG